MRSDPTAPTLEAPVADDTAAVEIRTTPFVSVVIPCLNEAQSIAEAVRRARQALDENGYDGEVIVADNGSTDGSPDLATEAGDGAAMAAPTSPDWRPRRASTSSWPMPT